MKSMTALIIVGAAVFALGTLCTAGEHVAATDLGNGAGFNGKKIQMKDKGEVAYILSFNAGKEFEATTDGTKNTDVNLYVYDAAGKEVGKDDSPGPKCSRLSRPFTSCFRSAETARRTGSKGCSSFLST